MEKIEYKRLPYMYQGRKIYEWEQSLEEVHCYIEPPPGVTAKMIEWSPSAAASAAPLPPLRCARRRGVIRS